MSHIFRHDPLSPPDEAPLWAVNAAQERLEERAEDEFASNHPNVRKWLWDCDIDIADFAPLLSAAARVYSSNGRVEVDNLIGDWLTRYKQWRANDDDLSEIIREVQEDAREDREGQAEDYASALREEQRLQRGCPAVVGAEFLDD